MFDENKHPRADDGKFTDGNNNSKSEKLERAERIYNSDPPSTPNLTAESNKVELNALLGEEFKGFKGQDAVNKLIQEKRGHVKGAFHREDIGDIDLLWGNENVGLKHAIEQRLKEKNGEAHAQDMLDNLAEAINKGMYSKRNDRGNFEFIFKKDGVEYRTIIAPEYHKNKITYVLTAFRRGKLLNNK